MVNEATKASASLELKHAFVLAAADAQKIWSLLADSFDKVTATASCSDGIQREFASSDQLSSYENARSRQIRGLTYQAISKDYHTASVQFAAHYSWSSIEFRASAPEPMVLEMKNRFADIIDGMRPWYSPITRVDFTYIVMGLLFFAMIVLQATSSGGSTPAMTLRQAVSGAALLLVFFVGIGAVIWILNKLRDRFFPNGVFAIGQGATRHDFDEKIRWAVIVGFVVSTFASLVVAFLLPVT